ncbi:MAG: phosphate butyryltransferase [Mariniphaga sp.]|nr:phosphate butyryltransferase [Mariniphaga sp.]
MAVRKLIELFELLKEKTLKTMVVVCANDEHTISAVSEAVVNKLVKGVLIGDEAIIMSVCRESGIDINQFRIIHQPIDDLASQLAVEMINRGEGDILMKGLVNTDKFMRAILNKEKGLTEPGKVVSHVTLVENECYHKLLIVGDVAIIPLPDLNQKVQIIKYMVEVAKRLGIDLPKVAAIAPSEQVLPSIISTVDAALLAKMSDRGQIPGCVVDGPLALDVAIDMDSVAIKGLKSAVAGDADCLLFPNIETGNVFYKVNTKLAKSESAAVMVGARVPVVLASRGDSARVKLLSIALAALMTN